METVMNPVLKKGIVEYFKALSKVCEQIPEQKKSRLGDLALYIESKLKSKAHVNMVFFSPTDNSLSHLAQVWAKALAMHYNLEALDAYSAVKGTMSVNPIIMKIISNYGFEIRKAKNGVNPVYDVKYADKAPVIKLFSKPLDHPENPDERFVALILNPGDAETFIPGADFKVPLNYEINPGEKDEEKYDRICMEIGADIFYMFSRITMTGLSR
jgi:arsenate reductase (thioredoxin)